MRATLFIAASAMLVAAVIAESPFNDCAGYPGRQASACEPQGSTPCTRGQRMSLRTGLVRKRLPGLTGGVTEEYASWGFCPVVDQLQAYNLSQGMTFAVGLQPSIFQNINVFWNTTGVQINETFVVMGNFGYAGTTPTNSSSDSYVKVFDLNSNTLCPVTNGVQPVAIVNFLILNITMTNGYFRQIMSFPQSIQVGFQPTCDANDQCTMGTGVCIGDKPGRKNCATCYASPADVARAEMHIWAAYYGTDQRGRVMTSGGDNPLNFEQFSQKPIVNDLKSSLSGA